MLVTVSLSEEELGLLFCPASNGGGAVKSQQDHLTAGGRKSSRPRVSSTKHAARAQQRKKKTTASKSSSSMTANSSSILSAPRTSGVVPARCGYRTGKCQNLQAIKRNGTLHKLCEFHRERANLNQKKLDRKKRLQRSERSSTSKSPSPLHCGSVTSEDDASSVGSADLSPRTVDATEVLRSVFPTADPDDSVPVLPTSLHEAPLELSCEELAIFCSLMSHDLRRKPRRLAEPRVASSRPCTGVPSVHEHRVKRLSARGCQVG